MSRGPLTHPTFPTEIPHAKLSAGSGNKDMVSNSVRRIRKVHFGNTNDRLAQSPTGSRSLSKQTVDLEGINRTCPSGTEFELKSGQV